MGAARRLPTTRRARGYWDAFASLEAELRPLLQPGRPPALPTHAQLLAAGRSDVVRAIRIHGGSLAVAQRLGAVVKQG